jgi:hypothetical protein
MCENVVSFIFPTMLRLRDSGLRVQFVLSVTPDHRLRENKVFTTALNPVSVDELTKSFFEVRTLQSTAEIGPETNFFSTSTVSRRRKSSSNSGDSPTKSSVIRKTNRRRLRGCHIPRKATGALRIAYFGPVPRLFEKRGHSFGVEEQRQNIIGPHGDGKVPH